MIIGVERGDELHVGFAFQELHGLGAGIEKRVDGLGIKVIAGLNL